VAIVIESENQAWDLLRQVLDREFPAEHGEVVEFRGWTGLSVHLPNTPISASITPSIMEAFIDVQKTIYRTYTLVSADTADLRTLSKAERDALEFRVVVSKGSSDYATPFAQALEKIGVEALAHMPPEMALTAILAIALIIGGGYCFNKWLSSRIELRRLEVATEERGAWLAAQKAAIDAQRAAEDTGVRHAEILARALERAPVAADVEAFADTSRSSLVRAVGEEGGGSINRTVVDRDLAAEVSRQTRQAGEPIRQAGDFRVAKIDANTPEGFRVTLVDIETGAEITAMLQDVFLSTEHREIITEAEWGKQPFYAEITARRVRNRIVDAVVVVARRSERVS
jgi:hypothetical protein